jgi:hypothetical protein
VHLTNQTICSFSNEGCRCRCGHDFCYSCSYSPYRIHNCRGDLNDPNDDDNDDDDDDGWGDQLPEWQEFYNEDGDPVCPHTAFVHSRYGGHYEGACGDHLPYFLNACRNCGLRVCNYCLADRSFVPRDQVNETFEEESVGQHEPVEINETSDASVDLEVNHTASNEESHEEENHDE